MDTEKKDNLTDITEELEGVETPEDNMDAQTSQTVLDGDGEEVTLGEDSESTK